MLHLLDEGLEAFLRAELGPAAGGIDVSFALPDKDWGVGLSRPTLNLFLCSVNPVSHDAAAGLERFVEDGQGRRRAALPRMEFTYLISAWATEAGDEHRLLGALLAILARARKLEEPHLPEALRGVHPWPSLRLGTDTNDIFDLWKAIGGRFHPAVALAVAASVDPGVAEATAEPPEEMALVVSDQRQPKRRDERRVRPTGPRPAGTTNGTGG
ncbi:MAG: Pvc16 family protein [Acidimicrobiia bacterium]